MCVFACLKVIESAASNDERSAALLMWQVFGLIQACTDTTQIDAHSACATTNVACIYAPRVAAEDDACVCAAAMVIAQSIAY